jgi:hypothetical protein
MWPLFVALILGQTPQPGPAVDQTQKTLEECDGKGTILQTIRAVNLLVGLGPQASKQALEAYFQTKTANGKTGLYAVLNCLFEVPNPPGYLPPPRITPKQFVAIPTLKQVPRYPFELAGGVPILVAPVSTGNVEWETELHYFERLEKVAQQRTTPLVPVDQPWRLLRTGDYAGNFRFDPLQMEANRNILELVSTACQSGDGFATPRAWRRTVAQLEGVHMHWDRAQQQYVLPDGSTLAQETKDPMAPITWTDPILQPAQATVTIQRRSPSVVDFSCSYLGQRGTGFRSLSIRILVGGVGTPTATNLVAFDRSKRKIFVRGESPIEVARTSLAIPSGTRIVFEVTVDGTTLRSFPITP